MAVNRPMMESYLDQKIHEMEYYAPNKHAFTLAKNDFNSKDKEKAETTWKTVVKSVNKEQDPYFVPLKNAIKSIEVERASSTYRDYLAELIFLDEVRRTAEPEEMIFASLCGETGMERAKSFSYFIGEILTTRRINDLARENPNLRTDHLYEEEKQKDNNTDRYINYLKARRTGDIVTEAEVGFLLHNLGFHKVDKNQNFLIFMARLISVGIGREAPIYDRDDSWASSEYMRVVDSDGKRETKRNYERIQEFLNRYAGGKGNDSSYQPEYGKEKSYLTYDPELLDEVFPEGIPHKVEDFSQQLTQYIIANKERYIGRDTYTGEIEISDYHKNNVVQRK